MADHFQTVVAPSITESAAPSKAAAVLEWLITEEIVSTEARDCVLGADSGHPPGCKAQKATKTADAVPELRVNGVEVSAERRVFDAGQSGFALICRGCGATFDEELDGWADAVGEWFDDVGPGHLECPICNTARPITEWTFATVSPWSASWPSSTLTRRPKPPIDYPAARRASRHRRRWSGWESTALGELVQ